MAWGRRSTADETSRARRLELVTEPRLATNPEAPLDRLVLRTVADRGPDERGADDEERQCNEDDEQHPRDRVHGVITNRTVCPWGANRPSSSPVTTSNVNSPSASRR